MSKTAKDVVKKILKEEMPDLAEEKRKRIVDRFVKTFGLQNVVLVDLSDIKFINGYAGVKTVPITSPGPQSKQ